MSFGKELKDTSNKSNNVGKWRAVPKWQIIALLILFFPVGLYVLWRQNRWSKRTKAITTGITSAALIAFFALIIIFAPPTVTITSSSASVKADSYQLTGIISPAGSIVTVNGLKAEVAGDTFSSNVKLNEGDNTLKVVIVSGSNRTEQEFKIHRYTKSEVVAQEKLKAKKKADEVAAKANADADAKTKANATEEKKKIDEAAAVQAQKQAVAAKARSDASASAKPAAPVAAPTPTVTVSQKNALSKARSYLDYTAFSHDGLVDQLVYEQFSTADATYGADNVGGNWNEQAAKKAKSYMEYSSFSRGSLISQLEYDKFTTAQSTYGADSVGL